MTNYDAIVALMDDALCEQVHADCAPCTNAEFIAAYLLLDPDFIHVLAQEYKE